MNEEIKEILERFKNNYDELGLSYYPEDILGPKELKPLYNYITNLQEENQKLNKIIDELEKYIKENSIYYNTSDGCQWVDQFKLLDKLIELKKSMKF